MDTISAGMAIAFACECFEKGVISRTETDGLELRFGDPDLMIRLLEMIAHRKGFGRVLGEGVARMAQMWGAGEEPYHLSVKGCEIPMHEPRAKAGVGLGYAISTYGADHMVAPHDPYFIDEKFLTFQIVKALGIHRPMSAYEMTSDKVRSTVILGNLWRMMDALGLCVFGFAPRGPMPLDTMVKCLNAVTGWNTSLYELMLAGDRGTAMARAFNSREGFSIKDDRLPKRFFEPLPDGPNAGKTSFTEKEFDDAVKLFYEITGCDPKTGRPSRGKLVELDLEWVDKLLSE
jgi:aldehyde:ferredoxin oxidoreductase